MDYINACEYFILMRILCSEKFLEHENNAAECPDRIDSIIEYLKNKNFGKWEEPNAATEEDILLAHDRVLLEKVGECSEDGRDFPDNAFRKNTFEIAMLSAGSAICAAESCFAETSFSLTRPPGHHATKSDFGGFCYFNNLAIACSKILEQKMAKRILIVDFDAHHGNGTQDIFYENESVFYVSLHQFPAYPGSGSPMENNEHVVNVPLPPGTRDGKYLERFSSSLEKGIEFSPEIVAVSAGFDAYKKDQLAGLCLDSGTYGKIGKKIAMLSLPTFMVLEGGYFLPDLGKNAYEFLRQF